MFLKNLFKKKTQPIVQEKSKVNINRLQELKQLKQIASTFLNFYLERQKHDEKKWENDLSTRNITLLKGTISKINKLQHDNKIKEYLQALRNNSSITPNATKEEKEEAFNNYAKDFTTVFSQGTNFFLLMEIIRYSPRLSYFNDLNWFYHGTIQEHIEYGLGKTDETVFEKYLPYQISRIKETKLTFFSKDFYKDDLVLLEVILSTIKNEKLIPANILTITLIEGLVRKFAFMVYKKQNPDKPDIEVDIFTYSRNLSFESLIRNKEWKKDIPVKFSELIHEYSHTENHPSPTMKKN